MSFQIQPDAAAKAQQDNNVIAPNNNNAASLKNEFMTLMIAQIKNQDPSKPMDANQYVSQLATFAQVESLEHIRNNQKAQSNMLEHLGLVQSASLLGKHALVQADHFQLNDKPIHGKVYLDSAAETMDINIVDRMGNIVGTKSFGARAPGDVPFTLDPKELGLPKGEYKLQVLAKQGDQTMLVKSYLRAPIDKIHFVSAKGTMMAELGNGLGTLPVLDISEVS